MSLYLKEYHAFSLHIPRTGGTWVSSALLNLGIQQSRCHGGLRSGFAKKHSAIAHYRKQRDIKLMFAFVRHPVSYYESVWKWLHTRTRGRGLKEGRWKWHPFKSVGTIPIPDFNSWVGFVLEKEPLWYTRLIEMYVGPKDGEWCHFIGRTESLVSDFKHLMEALNIDVAGKLDKMPQHNFISREIEWDSQLKKRVLESERLLVDRFYGEETKDRRWFSKCIYN